MTGTTDDLQSLLVRLLGFMLSGVAATVTDVSIFLALRQCGLKRLLLTSFISTSCGIIVSFALNHYLVFASASGQSVQTIVRFVGIAALVSWLVQPLLITKLLSLTKGSWATVSLKHLTFVPSCLRQLSLSRELFAKLGAIGACFVLSFIAYNWLVFR